MIHLKDNLPAIYGDFYLQIIKNNIVVDEKYLTNTIMNTGKTLLNNLLVGYDVANKKIGKIGVGDSAATNESSMYWLQGANTFIKNILSYSFVGATQTKINFELGTSDANGINIKEFALFSNDATVMFNRVLWTGNEVIKTSSFALRGYFLITVV